MAAGVGILIGLEREYSPHNVFAGIRTFPIFSIVGFLSAQMARELTPWIFVTALLGVTALVSVSYLTASRKGDFGATTEATSLATFLLGGLIAAGEIALALSAFTIVLALLSLKSALHALVRKIPQQEAFVFLKFVVLVMILLPWLPDRDFGPYGALNPRTLLYFVVLVSGLSFAGYALTRLLGAKKGILLTALLGGLFSSTAIAWDFSRKSANHPALAASYAASVVAASSVMFPRLLVLLALFNPELAVTLVPPLLAAAAGGFAFSSFALRRRDGAAKLPHEAPLKNPLNLGAALQFAAFFVAIVFAIRAANDAFGAGGTYLTSAVSGLTDIDAVSISVAKLAPVSLDAAAAANAILLAVLANTFMKATLCLAFGAPRLKNVTAAGFGAIAAAGALAWSLARFL